VDDPPGQIVPGEAIAVTVGIGLTLIVTLAVAEQIPPLFPVTVYVVCCVGVTVMLAVVSPVFHE